MAKQKIKLVNENNTGLVSEINVDCDTEMLIFNCGSIENQVVFSMDDLKNFEEMIKTAFKDDKDKPKGLLRAVFLPDYVKVSKVKIKVRGKKL